MRYAPATLWAHELFEACWVFARTSVFSASSTTPPPVAIWATNLRRSACSNWSTARPAQRSVGRNRSACGQAAYPPNPTRAEARSGTASTSSAC